MTLDSEFNSTSLDTSIWQSGWFGTGITSPVNALEADCYSSSNVTFPGDGTMHLAVTQGPVDLRRGHPPVHRRARVLEPV